MTGSRAAQLRLADVAIGSTPARARRVGVRVDLRVLRDQP